jgi:hypothetical protein
MEKQKYIVFKDGSVNIFDCGEIHSYMTGGKDVVSAGFVMVDSDNFPTEVFGESTILGVKSRKEDLKILQDFLIK